MDGQVVLSPNPQMSDPMIEFQVEKIDGNFPKDLGLTADKYQGALQLPPGYCVVQTKDGIVITSHEKIMANRVRVFYIFCDTRTPPYIELVPNFCIQVMPY